MTVRFLEKQLSIPQRDVAGALAVFIAGSYMAYRNTDIPDAQFPPLMKQMREVLQASSGFESATVAARQDMYEQLAILGTVMATTRLGRNDPKQAESARVAAKGYLEKLLGVDADRIQIGATGLVIAPAGAKRPGSPRWKRCPALALVLK